jgi:hypothetical protein
LKGFLVLSIFFIVIVIPLERIASREADLVRRTYAWDSDMR